MGGFICFGEVLWDIFNDTKEIGGAPLNVALRLASFGNNVGIISAIGNDTYGKKLLTYLQSNDINTQYIQTNNDFETGKVQVSLDRQGSASYNIKYPSAWDKIICTPDMKNQVASADAFVFGSLVCRDTTSRTTLFTLLEKASFKVLDINLRKPHYSLFILEELMQKANFIKFNDDEIYEIATELGSPYNSLEQHMAFLSQKTNTSQICVTKGSHGAVLLYDNKKYYNSGYLVEVSDTVGAGDSFLATLIHFLLKTKHPQKAIDYACSVGAMVSANKGANPKLTLEEINYFAQIT